MSKHPEPEGVGEMHAAPMEDESPQNPFPGLRPFEFEESGLFFGRSGQCDELLIKLSRTHFLAVVGTSGSGKSSLVRAGLLPALYGGLMGKAGSGWHIGILRPGNDPIGNLTRALNDPGVLEFEDDGIRDIQTQVSLRRGSRGLVEIVHQARLAPHESLLVVVDQFEEIFRYDRISEDEKYANDADAFVKLLIEAKRERNVYIVLTMRSEYLGDCAQFWDLPEAINEGQYLIPRMTREDCRKAITGPVELQGARISPGLVNQLLNDMALVKSRNQLPILQHALMRVWERWREEGDKKAELDFRHYEIVGGMSETLSRHAEEAFTELPDQHRQIAEKLFKCLTEKGTDERETRRPTELEEIRDIANAKEKEVIDVIDIFRREGRSFLMPAQNVELQNDSSIDISHESLISGWRRLKKWVEEETNSARIYRRLAENALMFREKGVLADPWLQEALDWRDLNKPNRAWARRHHARFYALLNPSVKGKARDIEIFNLAMGFLDRSERVRDDLRKAEKERRRKAVKRARQFAVAGAVVATVIFFFLVLTLRLLHQRDIAIANTEVMNIKIYRTAMHLAQQASESGKWGETNEYLSTLPVPGVDDLRGVDWLYLWGASHDELGTLREHSAEVSSVAFSPDGKLFATGSADQKVILWDARTRTRLRELKGHRDAILSVVFADDGKMLATGSADGWVKLWNTATGEEIRSLAPKGNVYQAQIVRSVAFAPNASSLAIGRNDGSVQIWDINVPPIELEPAHSKYVSSVVFFRNGTSIVSGSADGTVKLWDVKSGQGTDLISNEPGAPNSEVSEILSVAVSPDGNTIAVAFQKGLIKLWDATSLEERTTLKPHNNAAIRCLAFANNKTLIAGNDDATVKQWDLTNGTELRTLKGHSKQISAIAVSSDERTAVTGSADTTAKLWDLSAPAEPIKFTGSTRRVNAVAVFPLAESSNIASVNEDGSIKLWDLNNQRELSSRLEQSPSSVAAAAFSADGRQVAIGGADKTLKLWDVVTGRLIKVLSEHTNDVSFVAFSSDGRTLASGSQDKTVKLWDISTGKEILLPPLTHSGKVSSIAFSPDGNTVAAGGDDGTIKAWDTHSGKKLWEHLPAARDVLPSIGSAPDGRPLVSIILALAFSKDGNLLASGGTDRIARLWDAKKGTPLVTLIAHNNAVVSVAFSPDIENPRLATASYDGTVKFWDTNFKPNEPTREQELATLQSDPGAWLKSDPGNGKEPVGIRSLSFSSDGQTLATGKEDGSVEVWRAASKDLLKMPQ